MTFLGDTMKGALVVSLGRLWHLEEWVIVSGAACVIAGHLYPFWLKCKGGKGVATFIGVGLALSPSLFLWMIAGTAAVLICTRSLTLGMVGGFIFLCWRYHTIGSIRGLCTFDYCNRVYDHKTYV
ncbi:glycerol-3-phosphate acyltransferase [Lysinibacillus sp. MHQ-1]|nr:glycerol-3-phosphate acyltransferase [Lysinibacillus sp. MHQ-1]